MGVVPATVRTRVVRTRTAILVVLCASVGLAVLWMLLAELFGQGANGSTRDTLAAQAIVAGMTDQQAGLWGYVDTPQPTYLGLYVDGRNATAAQIAQLGRDTAGTAAAPAVATVAADVRAWETWAEGVRLQVLAGGVGDPLAEAAEGRRLFDRFRADAGVMARTVDHEHEEVFQARLQPASGELRYVDAGHGHCAVRRPGGELMRLSERSLPVGVEGAEGFREGRLTLEPGESLVVYSDGLVEIGDRMLDLGAYAAELDQAGGAEDAVRRLLRRVPARPADDVTVMVLRRSG